MRLELRRSNERVRPDEAIHFDLVVEMVKDLYRQEQSTSSCPPPLSLCLLAAPRR